ncbi:MAG: ATP-dependent RNA helicase HrpA [Desulfobacteraceae bacterium]|nr:ATP-dependent RNA helicase HrpA [Desulfobacteraceae bacterium]MBC2755627.1 ATP-dependent RNA helicase HrpA [Desulfobacteraceae bacterium]
MNIETLTPRLKKIEQLLPDAMHKTRHAVLREIKRIRQSKQGASGDKKLLNKINNLEKKLRASIDHKKHRLRHRPKISYDENLPIVDRRKDIIEAIQKHPVVIVSGETGSGKTTQLPKFCIEAGRGIEGLIGCTQPRRIAAMTVAQRISDELGESLGQSVGYKIRFADRTSKENAYIKMMTDGILLAEAQSDRYLNAYDTLIIDEAHERSLNIDFILGILRTLLQKRKDLKLIVTSATIDTEKFSKAFDNAPVIEVSGRMFPVEVRYWKAGGDDDSEEQTIVDHAVDAVDSIAGQYHAGDILVFMPTEHDIRETCENLEGRKYRHTIILPLYARLSAADQMKVFASHAGRKIIVATNVAETSITVPGIRYVVDTGVARISSYDPRTRTMSLPILSISKSSADQRMGRCGRVENGICIRLFSEENYNNRSLFTPPEILRANLAEVMLRMIALKLGDIQSFPFVDSPPSRQIKDGFDMLVELGAIVLNSKRKKDNAPFKLTNQGRLMARIPLGPRLSRMLIEAWEQGCIKEVAVIVSALTIADPREKPREAFTRAEAVHARFIDPASDFITLYNFWNACFKNSKAGKPFIRARDLKKFCKTHYMSFKRMREWQDVHEQIIDIFEESGFNFDKQPAVAKAENPDDVFSAHYIAIHKSILSGFLSNIAVKKEKNIYQATKQRQAMIFPGSGLFNKAGQWIVAAEMVETSRLFARRVAMVSSEWLEALGGFQCKYTYTNPRWQRNRGAVVADEQVSLYGLVIVSGRPVHFGSKNPEVASEIFFQSALIEGDVKTVLPFMSHNWSLIEDVRDIENRIRRRDLLVSETELFEFYRKRLPGVYDMPTLKKRIREKGSDDFLKMKQSDVLSVSPDDEQLSLFPDTISVGQETYDCAYRFEPGQDNDGVTVKMPVSAASFIPMESTDWVVPGLLEEKITELIKGLPKSYRKQLVPVAATVKVIMEEMPKFQGALINCLSRFLYDRLKVDIPASIWNEKELPGHLKMRITLTDASGEEICTSRDKGILLQSVPQTSRFEGFEEQRRRWEKTGLTTWDFEDLPEVINITAKNGNAFPVYPGLEKDSTGVNLRLFRNKDAAEKAHKEGVGQLYRQFFSKDLKFLKKNIALPTNAPEMARYFGGKKQIEQQMVDRVIQDLFCRNIRTRADFFDYAQQQVNHLVPVGQVLLKSILPVITVYQEARSLFYSIETSAANNPVVMGFIDELRKSLAGLMPDNFIELYDMDRMPDLVRYIKAIIVRAERGRADIDKDRKKAANVKPFTDSLNEMIGSLEPTTSSEKREAIEAFYWVIEEFKVSLFAQELKTAYPVSIKKLNHQVSRIRRMI